MNGGESKICFLVRGFHFKNLR